MLDKNDLKAIAELVNGTEEQMFEKITGAEGRLTEKIEGMLHESENMILKRMEQMEQNIRGDIKNLEKRMETLEEKYRMQSTETADTIRILLRMYEQLEKRLEILEKKIA